MQICWNFWRKGTASQQIHSKVKVSSANFSWWLFKCKKTQISIDFWQWYWSSKTFMIWLKKRHTWDNLTKSDCLRCYLPLVTKKWPPSKKSKILSRDIDDQRFLQSDYMRGATGHTQPKRVVLDTNVHLKLFPCKKPPKNSIVSKH